MPEPQRAAAASLLRMNRPSLRLDLTSRPARSGKDLHPDPTRSRSSAKPSRMALLTLQDAQVRHCRRSCLQALA
jgi:hypothetical protein